MEICFLVPGTTIQLSRISNLNIHIGMSFRLIDRLCGPQTIRTFHKSVEGRRHSLLHKTPQKPQKVITKFPPVLTSTVFDYLRLDYLHNYKYT